MYYKKLITFVTSSFVVFSLLLPQGVFALQFSDIRPVGNNAEAEAYARAIFSTVPVMIAVGQCESGFRQFAPDGQVLRGGGGTVVGVYQIHEASHAAYALSLGYDILTVQGNILYAKYLYEKQGITPWMAAFSCFSAAPSSSSDAMPLVSVPSAAGMPLTRDLSFGMNHKEVQVLQQLLNKLGYTVARSGLGSPGNEVTNFGSLTRAAVRKFQCAEAIVCSGDEHSSGYGLVNNATRQALISKDGASNTDPLVGVAAPGLVQQFMLTRTLVRGTSGEDVLYLQNFLKKQGFLSAIPNSVFGPATQAAVIAFQRTHGIIPAEGIVGPLTQAAIKSALGL